MNWKRIALATTIAFFLVTILDVLWNAVVLRELFKETRQYWRPVDQLNRLVPLAWVAMLLMTFLTGMLFVRLCGSGLRRGVEFGFWLGLTFLVGALAMATLVPWPLELVAAMGLQQMLSQLIVGICFGLLYRKAGAPKLSLSPKSS